MEFWIPIGPVSFKLSRWRLEPSLETAQPAVSDDLETMVFFFRSFCCGQFFAKSNCTQPLDVP